MHQLGDVTEPDLLPSARDRVVDRKIFCGFHPLELAMTAETRLG